MKVLLRGQRISEALKVRKKHNLAGKNQKKKPKENQKKSPREKETQNPMLLWTIALEG